MNEDARLHYKNMVEGIDEYLKREGRLIVTPKGPFCTLAEAALATDSYKTTVVRRCESSKTIYQNWYFLNGISGINIAEECSYCDQLDDMLFRENCWLENVEDHLHTTPILGKSTINYLFKGLHYKITLDDWLSGCRPHTNYNDEEN